MEYPNLHPDWNLMPSRVQMNPTQAPVKTLPTNEVDKVRILSEIILRESPIQQNLPLLPQLIERQKLLRHLISGPTSSPPQLTLPPAPASPFPNPISSAAMPVVVSSRSAPTAGSPGLVSSVPSTSYSEPPVMASLPHQPSPGPSSVSMLSEGPESPIDVVRVDSTSSGSSSEGSISRKRKLSSDNVSICSMAELSTSPHLFEISEKHFTEVFTKQRLGGGESPPMPPVSSERPNAKLISMLNRCVSDMKAMLSQRGVPINVDDNGMPVDYSSRPVDEIFKQSRKQLEALRAFKDNGKH